MTLHRSIAIRIIQSRVSCIRMRVISSHQVHGGIKDIIKIIQTIVLRKNNNLYRISKVELNQIITILRINLMSSRITPIIRVEAIWNSSESNSTW